MPGVARHQPDPHLGRDQAHALGAEPEVAARGELERAAHAHPSITATTGTGAARTTRVMRWKASIVSAHAAVSASIAAWRSSPAEYPRSAHSDHAHRRIASRHLDLGSDLLHRGQVQALRRA